MKSLFLLPVALAVLAADPTPPVPAGPNDWTVDPVHSTVMFRVKHANASYFKGSFATITGAVTIDPAKPEAGSVQMTIPVESVDTNNKDRDAHLKNADFFNAKENPEITFKSSKIAKKGNAFDVTGELAMLGKKKEITIPVEKVGEGEMRGTPVAGFSTKFTIKRSDFGLGSKFDAKMLGDEIELWIDLELNPKK
jgi:polyisoprenoid-binding protein YceI